MYIFVKYTMIRAWDGYSTGIVRESKWFTSKDGSVVEVIGVVKQMN